MKILCNIFGHRWNKSDKYRQPCKRCGVIRYKNIDKLKQYTGEKCIEWTIMESPKF